MSIVKNKSDNGVIPAELYNHSLSKKWEIISQYFTIRDRLNIAIEEPFETDRNDRMEIKVSAMDTFICYNVISAINHDIAKIPINRYYITYLNYYFRIYISLSLLDSYEHSLRIADSVMGKYATYEFNFIDSTSISNQKPLAYYISSYSIFAESLNYPYVDDCIDYKILGFVDRDDAISSCINDYILNTTSKLYRMKLFTHPVDHIAATTSYNVDSIANICHSIYHRPECSIELLHSGLSIGESTFPEYHAIQQNFVHEPSIGFYSNPKTKIVGYVTYIFGALGTWLGFSFLGVDPVSSLMIGKSNDNQSKDIQSQNVQRFQKLETIIEHQANLIEGLSNEMKRLKSHQRYLYSKIVSDNDN